MALLPEVKAVLACPKCKGTLEFHEEIHQIHCTPCRRSFEIRDETPVMVFEEAKLLP